MKPKYWTLLLFILVVCASCISLFIGVMHLSIQDLFAGNFEQIEILFISRLPRLLAILCTGAGMSIAGFIMQQLCMNKFVSPSTGATISSAQFGILIAMLIFPQSSLFEKTLFAFISAIVGTFMFVYLMQKLKLKDIIMVPLLGIMFGNIIAGIIDYISYKHGLTQALSSWLTGDFSLIVKGRYEIVFLIVPLIMLAAVYANHFNIVGMGEGFSKNLGVHYKKILLLGLSIAAIITASVVATVGAIPYIGLIIPNIITMLKGDRMKGSILDIALSGALFVLICDMLGRFIIYPYELPVHLMIGIIGSILFIILMFQRLHPSKSLFRKQKQAITYMREGGKCS